MKRTILFTAIALLIMIVGMGCEKEQYLPPADPAKAILGKWELISSGGMPITDPYEYKEFLPSGIVRKYDYKTQQYTTDECEYSFVNDSISNDTVLQMCGFRFEYDFFYDKMKLYPLDTAPLVDPTEIYKRIK